MMVVFLTIFVIAFFLNLLYELLHSVLYTTCLEARGKFYRYLMLKGASFDACAITAVFFASRFLFGSYWQGAFLGLGLAFAYIWEAYSLKKKKWEYAKTMPKVLGVGLTPFIQLALTGFASLAIAGHFLV